MRDYMTGWFECKYYGTGWGHAVIPYIASLAGCGTRSPLITFLITNYNHLISVYHLGIQGYDWSIKWLDMLQVISVSSVLRLYDFNVVFYVAFSCRVSAWQEVHDLFELA